MLVKLKTGTINIKTDQPQFLERLTGFSSRPNKKRGFVFVSKVLGKHYPAKPAMMANVYKQLAAQVRAKLDDNPTMVIGFAETATGLGNGVYQYLGLSNSFYIHTTRYKLSHPVWLGFQEEHCHAPSHFLYDFADANRHVELDKVTNVVLIDDEFSTGQTLNNLVRNLHIKKKL